MNKENQEDDFDSFDVACARSAAKLNAAMDGCRPHFQTCEDFQKEQAAHYTREAKEATAAKVKSETSLEMFRRISQARDAKTVKAATSAAKKLVKQKKTKRLTSYFVSTKK
jgi:16S rRNA G527 N7-methylase RsmG